jgi:uncharacterized membrane protein YagU involved in acid resistance
MGSNALGSGVAVGVIGGYVGTKAMNLVTTKLYEMAPAEDKEREKQVSPGSPYKIGVTKAANALGIKLNGAQLDLAASVMPYTLGISGGVLYVMLRRIAHMNPVVASLATGMTLFIGVDEGLTPTLGLSAPNSEYPLSTHLRGFVGHLAYGLAVGATAEVVAALLLGGQAGEGLLPPHAVIPVEVFLRRRSR